MSPSEVKKSGWTTFPRAIFLCLGNPRNGELSIFKEKWINLKKGDVETQNIYCVFCYRRISNHRLIGVFYTILFLFEQPINALGSEADANSKLI